MLVYFIMCFAYYVFCLNVDPAAAATSAAAATATATGFGWPHHQKKPNDVSWRNLNEWWGVYDQAPPACLVWALMGYSMQHPTLRQVIQIGGVLKHIVTYAQGPIMDD